MIDVYALDGFDWDLGNLTKNWERHLVSTAECEEVFFNVPLLLQEDIKHSQQESRYFGLGRTEAGRRLMVAFSVRGTKIRVISARPMNRKERQIYDEADT